VNSPPPSDDRPTPGRRNPFSTRHVRPGALPFVFPPGQSAAALVDRLRAQGWRGEIVGPHGSGKSSLLAALIPAIHDAGRPTLLVTLHDGQRRLPQSVRWAEIAAGTIVVVDGFEQLSAWSRFRLEALCRRRNLGLVVTSHASVGLPPLWTTEVTPELARRLVNQLLGDESAVISPDEVDSCLARHRGNLRETLFELYDLYESRK
jgi:energy-coupling factor transporter ATP-binding protein EcfA2